MPTPPEFDLPPATETRFLPFWCLRFVPPSPGAMPVELGITMDQLEMAVPLGDEIFSKLDIADEHRGETAKELVHMGLMRPYHDVNWDVLFYQALFALMRSDWAYRPNGFQTDAGWPVGAVFVIGARDGEATLRTEPPGAWVPRRTASTH